VSRSLARRAFADRLPASVLDETRKGYQAADWYEGVGAGLGEARDQMAGLDGIAGVAGTLDTPRLQALIEEWPQGGRPPGGWNSHENIARYRLALMRGLSAGHFLRKAAGSNR
jgi:asparagine synthase (glutamine-hydrolysing)